MPPPRSAALRHDTPAPVPYNTRLKLAIVKRGISQTELAARLKISIFRLSRIVRGKQAPTPDEQDRLADILGESRRSLFRVIAS